MAYTHEDRLNNLKLITLETRRLIGDLNEVYKMFKGFNNLDPLMYFYLYTAPTRGQCYSM